MAKGGKRVGAGRKGFAQEENVREAIKNALGVDSLSKIWGKIIEKAAQGSDKHAQLLFNYYYGKPRENEGQATEMIIHVKRNG